MKKGKTKKMMINIEAGLVTRIGKMAEQTGHTVPELVWHCLERRISHLERKHAKRIFLEKSHAQPIKKKKVKAKKKKNVVARKKKVAAVPAQAAA